MAILSASWSPKGIRLTGALALPSLYQCFLFPHTSHLSPAFSFLVPFLMSLESLAIHKSAPKRGWTEKESLSLGLGGALNRPYNASMLVYKAGIIIPWVTGTQRSSGTCTRSHSKKVMSRDWDSSTSHSKTSPWNAESLLLTYVEWGR